MNAPIRLETWHDKPISIAGTGRPPVRAKEAPSAGKYGFNLKFLGGLLRLAKFGQKWDLLITFALFVLVALNMYMGSISGTITGQFYNIIVTKNEVDFKTLIWHASLVVIVSSMLESFIKFVLDIIAYRWRKTLVTHLHQRYFAKGMYYQVLHLDQTIDNPDQRIAQDLDMLTQSFGKILRVVFDAPLTIGFYGYLVVTTITWYSPVLVIGYWLLAYVINKLVMNPSVAAVFRQENLEGNFRFGHLRVRTYAESIALYGGSERERQIAEVSFKALLANRLRLIRWETCITATSNLFAYFASIVNYAIVSLPIFKGWKLPPNAGSAAEYVSVSSMRLLMFINGFSQINSASREMTDFIGLCNRVSQLFETIETLENSELSKHFEDGDRVFDFLSHVSVRIPSVTSPEDPSDVSMPLILPSSSSEEALDSTPADEGDAKKHDAISFKSVSVFSPSGQPLIKNLTISIPYGMSLLITGPSGSGKTSLLRCLSGLWRSFDGQITRTSSILFVPQRPYLPFGSLQDQITYPLATPEDVLQGETRGITEPSRIGEDELWELLKAVELEYLVHRQHALGSVTWKAKEAMRDMLDGEEIDLPTSEKTSLLQADTMANRLHDLVHQMESSNLNWTEVLSPGEQQRIGLARVLYHRPRVAVLDEATSCVDEPLEAKFYALCRQYNITVLTVGHKSSLNQFHDRCLSVDRKGRWELRALHL